MPLDPSSQEFADARRALEERAASIIGLRLAAVRYVTVGFGTEIGEERFPDFDLLDFGVDLVGDDGRVLHVTWGDEFEHFNIVILEGGFDTTGEDERFLKWDASSDSRWAGLVGRTVTNVEIQWYEDVETTTDVPMWAAGHLLATGLLAAANEPAKPDPDAPTPRRPLSLRLGLWLLAVWGWILTKLGRSDSREVAFPFSLALRFGDEQVWIAAFEDRDPEPWRGANSITVVFQEDVARRFGLAG